MKKYPIGFNTRINKEPENQTPVTTYQETVHPKKSIVQVYFPHRGMGWAYYNDSFDLKVGDFVYVEGKLEGYRGQVTEVNYSFKIKLSDYKKVVAVIDTNVNLKIRFVYVVLKFIRRSETIKVLESIIQTRLNICLPLLLFSKVVSCIKGYL